MVLISGLDTKTGKFTVIDVDSQRVLGTKLVSRSGGPGATMFTRDGGEVCLATDDGYVAWDYAADKIHVLSHQPRVLEGGINAFGQSGWNYDRSVGIQYPYELPEMSIEPASRGKGSQPASTIQMRHAKPKLEPGEVLLPMAVTFSISPSDRAGFDQFGSAWFGHKGDWSKVDRNGKVTRSLLRAPALTQDQTRDRGSLHLVGKEQEMSFQGSRSYVTCIWLTHDHAVPFRRIVDGKTIQVDESYRAAVVFAGPDVVTYGFLPGRDLIYVVSNFGSYLVPFETTAADPRE